MHQQKEAKKNEELEEVEAELGKTTRGGSEAVRFFVVVVASAYGHLQRIWNREANPHHPLWIEHVCFTRTHTHTNAHTAMAVFMQAFTLTFFAEWGDRSQIATIGLAAVHDPVGVWLLSFLGLRTTSGDNWRNNWSRIVHWTCRAWRTLIGHSNFGKTSGVRLCVSHSQILTMQLGRRHLVLCVCCSLLLHGTLTSRVLIHVLPCTHTHTHINIYTLSLVQ